MVKYSDTNSNRVMNDSQDVILKAEISDGNTHYVVLPGDPNVFDFQSVRVLAKVSNDSVYEIRVDTDRDGTNENVYSIYTPRSVHLMYDGDEWLFVSDDKIRAIEDEEHPLTALSGNKIKDQDGNLIEQSGVDVVGISSINGKTPLYTTDTIDADTVNGKTPVFNGDDVTLGDVICDTISLGQGGIVRRVEVDNTVAGSFYDAVQEYYGLPGQNELVECLIKGAEYSGGYYRSYTYTGIFYSGGVYRPIGSISYFGATSGYAYTGPSFTDTSNPNSTTISKHYFYV